MNSTVELSGNSNNTWGEHLLTTTESPPTVAESWNWVVALFIIIAFVACSGTWIVLRKLYRKYCNRRKARREAEEASKRVAEGLRGVPPDFDLSVSHVTV